MEVELPVHIVTELFAQRGHEHIFESHASTIGLTSKLLHILRETVILQKEFKARERTFTL